MAPHGTESAHRQGSPFLRANPSEETPMSKTPADVLSMIKEKEVKFVDLRFTDTRGKE